MRNESKKTESIEIASDAKVPKVNKTKKVSSKAKKTDKTATAEKVANTGKKDSAVNSSVSTQNRSR